MVQQYKLTVVSSGDLIHSMVILQVLRTRKKNHVRQYIYVCVLGKDSIVSNHYVVYCKVIRMSFVSVKLEKTVQSCLQGEENLLKNWSDTWN